VKRNRFFFWLALLPAVLFFGTGCTGINASQSVSPLSFFLPGLVQNNKADEPIASLPQNAPAQTVAQPL
jgi:hypothetical protein